MNLGIIKLMNLGGEEHLIEQSETAKRYTHCVTNMNKGFTPKQYFKRYHTPKVPCAQCPLQGTGYNSKTIIIFEGIVFKMGYHNIFMNK